MTLGREPSDIAALITAFFPRFPATSTDNQYHLQALRHFYALAARNRKIEAIDIDSREKIFIPIEVSRIHTIVFHGISFLNIFSQPC